MTLLSKLCKNGVEVERGLVVESISDLNQELLELKRGESAASMVGTADESDDTIAAATHNEENTVTNGDDGARARKRARISVSPDYMPSSFAIPE